MNIFSKKDRNKEVFLKLLSFADNSYAGNITQILKKAMSELGITSKFMIEADRFNVLTDAVNILLADRRVQWEVVEKEIKNVCALLGFESIPDAIVESVDMIRLAFLSNAGHPEPLPPPSSLLMKRGESLLFSTPGNILEERVIDRRYEGGSRGISIRIMKGVSYRVGSHRGHVVTDKAVIPVAHGMLYITDRRLIFNGAKSFTYPLSKIFQINVSGSKLFFSIEGKEEGRAVDMGEITFANLAYIMLRNAIAQAEGLQEISIKEEFDAANFDSQYLHLMNAAKSEVNKTSGCGIIIIGIIGVLFLLICVLVFRSGGGGKTEEKKASTPTPPAATSKGEPKQIAPVSEDVVSRPATGRDIRDVFEANRDHPYANSCFVYAAVATATSNNLDREKLPFAQAVERMRKVKDYATANPGNIPMFDHVTREEIDGIVALFHSAGYRKRILGSTDSELFLSCLNGGEPFPEHKPIYHGGDIAAAVRARMAEMEEESRAPISMDDIKSRPIRECYKQSIALLTSSPKAQKEWVIQSSTIDDTDAEITATRKGDTAHIEWHKLPTDGVQTCRVSKTNAQGEQVYSAEGMDEILADAPQFF